MYDERQMEHSKMRACVLGAVLGACSSPHAGGAAADASITPDDSGVPIRDGSSGDGSSGDGASSGDGGGDLPRSIYALAVDRTWHWNYMAGGGGNPPVACDEVATVTGTIDVDDRHAFVQVFTYNCPDSVSTGTSYLSVGADDRLEFRSSNDATWYVWDAPSEGHTWSTGPNGALVYTWHATSTATVPAGTFSDCWTVSTMSSGSNQHFTYCRDIGEATTDQLFSTGFEQASQLVSKNF